MKGAVAAGHALTAAAGARVLEEGGNAVDACVAASFAAWVAESPLTGPGAGGFALVLPADGRPARVADFFVATPGLGRPVPAGAEMEAIDVGFGGDSETTQVFNIGEASCAVPGAALGLEAVHARYGRLPWRELLQPAIELARGGLAMSRQQAHLHAILDLILRHSDEGRRIYSRPDGTRLLPGDRLALPDLGETLVQLADEGSAALYRGELARAVVETMGSAGAVTKDDLEAYRVVWRRPVHASFHGHEVVSNPPPSSGGILIAYGLALLERVASADPGTAGAIIALAEVMREQTRAREAGFTTALRRGGLARRLLSEEGIAAGVARMTASLPGAAEPAPAGTTHVSAVDTDGNAASLSSSTGSGSGVIVPGTGIHLNNMLGEYDLVAGGPALPGRRLTSMMAPTVVVGRTGPRLVVGSAGSVRLRGAIMQVIANVLAHRMSVADAIHFPRVHVDEPHVHCEGGFDTAELDHVEAAGYDVVRWRRRNLFFGGTNAVEVEEDGELAAAGDERRGGAGVVVSS